MPFMQGWFQHNDPVLVINQASNYQLTAIDPPFAILTPGTIPLISATFTALGKHVALPDATGFRVGTQVAFKNDGGYPFAIRSFGNAGLTAPAAGGSCMVTLRDNSTPAGIWAITGGVNLEPGLIGLDTTYSSTYLGTATTAIAHNVALSATVGVSLLKITSNGFAVVATDYTPGANTQGSQVSVDTAATINLRGMFAMSATTAIIFWDDGTNYNARVVSVSSTLVCTLGTLATTATVIFDTLETGLVTPSICACTTSLYVAFRSLVGTDIYATAISVSGTTPTIGAQVARTNGTNQGIKGAFASSTTGAMVVYGDTTTSVKGDSVAITGSTTVTWGTASSAITVVTGSVLHPINQLTATKIIYAYLSTTTVINACCFSLSGTTVTANAELAVETGLTATPTITYTAPLNAGVTANRNRPALQPLTSTTMLLQYNNGGAAPLSRVVVISESGGTLTIPTAFLGSTVCSAAAAATLTGGVLWEGTTDFTALRFGNASNHVLVPHKINGTTITMGTGYPLAICGSQTSIVGFYPTRLSNGNCLIYGEVASGMLAAIPVFSTNGDYVKFKGQINIPVATNSVSVPMTISATQITINMAIGVGGGSAGSVARFVAVEVFA